MSSPGPSTSPAENPKQSRRKSLQMFMSRLVKKPGKKDDGRDAAASPVSPTAPAAPAPVAEAPAAKPAQAPAQAPKTISPAERARLIAKKHDVELTGDWPLPAKPAGERVEKPIRMRVHRFCHRCEASFGGEKVCPSCSHKRCKNCPRTPAKKDKKTKSKKKEKDIYAGLTLPNKSGGEPLVHKYIRHRVHWKCHKCENDFAGEVECKSCSHKRCKRCERDPPRKKKAAVEGDDGDGFATTSRPKVKGVIKWTCHQCQNAYTGTKECASCGHQRCKACQRERVTSSKQKEPQKTTTEQIGDALKAISIS